MNKRKKKSSTPAWATLARPCLKNKTKQNKPTMHRPWAWFPALQKTKQKRIQYLLAVTPYSPLPWPLATTYSFCLYRVASCHINGIIQCVSLCVWFFSVQNALSLTPLFWDRISLPSSSGITSTCHYACNVYVFKVHPCYSIHGRYTSILHFLSFLQHWALNSGPHHLRHSTSASFNMAE
jgi:hypothetical protein